MYNLLQAMFSTLWGDEPQPKRKGNSTQPIVEVVKLENKSASPVRAKRRYDISGDIVRLQDTFFDGHKMQSGFKIETTLHDLLIVCPRKRRGKSAYNTLVKALNNMGVELNIITNK